MSAKFSRMKFGKPYKKRLPRAGRGRISRGAAVFLVISVVMYLLCAAVVNIYPVIEDVSVKLLEANGSEIIHNAVLESIGDGDIYNKLMNITSDASGQITSVSANTVYMNKLKSALAVEILNNIEQFGSDGFSVPLGNLTDIILLSGMGPHIPFRIVPYGTVKVDFRSSFTEAGINQTRHEIYIDVTADMHAISAVAGVRTAVTTSVMAAQTVIVGRTPELLAMGKNE